MVKKGDADAALKGAAKVLTAEYFSDHVSHVCMEPLNATVKVDGDKVEVWSGNQSPGIMQILGSIGAGTTPDKVSVHTQLLGGGFGRRSDGDDVLHARDAGAKAVPGSPVKMIWSREDDMQNDKFRPLTAQRIEIGLDAKGDIVGWRHRIVNESYFGRVLPPPVFKAIGMHDVVSGGGGDMSYAVANHRVEWVRAPPRRRCRRLARHRGRLHQVRDRDADRRACRAQEHGPGGLSAGDAQGRSARRGRGQGGRRHGEVGREAAGPGGRHRLFRRAAQPHGGGGRDLARRRSPARSRSITSGPRSMPASRCSRRTSWRR